MIVLNALTHAFYNVLYGTCLNYSTVGNAPQQDCEGSDMEDEHSDAHSDAQSLTAEESKESTPSASSDTREYHYERYRDA